MCGIVGLVSRTATERGAEQVQRGLAALRHRGPDAEGSRHIVGRASVAVLGVDRLRVIDATPGSDQPLANEGGDVWVAFNGEIYNYRELRFELQQAGHEFRSAGDTEVLVHLYEDTGGDMPAMLARLRGMFAFALYDAARDRLVLARDRLGIKPLYLCHTSDGVAFASEARALVRAGWCAGAPDPTAIASYLAHGVVTGTRMTLTGIEALPPAHFFEWIAGRDPVAVRWWEATPVPDAGLADPYVAAMVMRAALQDAVARHLVADRPVGLFLSGGLDSRAVLSLCAEAGARVRSLTVTFPDSGTADEGEAAAAAAAEMGVSHGVVPVAVREVQDHVYSALAAMDQPSMDAINTWLVSRAAGSEGLVACLSGLGGDELFGGYPSFHLAERVMRLRWLGAAAPSPMRRSLARWASHRAPGSRASRALDASGGIEGAYAAVRRLFSAAELEAVLPSGCSGGDEWARRDASTRTIPALAIARLEMTRYLPDQLLRDADAMSMAHSVELRVPLLDDLVVRTALAIPATARFAPGKGLLARATNLPLQRRKRTFSLPMDSWMRGPLREMVREGLLSERLPFADFIAKEWRCRLSDAFDRGATHWSRAWAVTVLRHWPGASGLAW